MKATTTEYLHCPLCGFEFEKRDTPCAHGCPLGRFCKLVCCPNCSYEFPPGPQVFGWVQRVFHRFEVGAPPRRGLLGLDELREGEHARLVCLNCAQHARRNTLAIYGLAPGSEFVLEQKRPAFVVRIGETELALEPAIAREILVEPISPRLPCT